jgi:hypothetical protein
MAANQEYIPGICNIGPAEIQKRKMAGWLGLSATIIVWVLFWIFHTPAPWRLLLFLPAAGSAVGFLQAAFHFCAAFGMLGVFNFGSQVGKTESVAQAEFRRKDQQKAIQIIIYSAMIGMAVAGLGYFLVFP